LIRRAGGDGRDDVVAFDLAEHAERWRWRWRVETSDSRHIKLSADGKLVWPAGEGAGLASPS
jgi:hypothetical protein